MTVSTIAGDSWALDHIAHAVGDIDQAIASYCNLYNAKIHCRESLDDEGVDVAFLQYGNSLVELISPQIDNPNAPLTKFLQQRGPGLHHICFAVPSVAEELRRLAKRGVKLIDSNPRKGSRGMNVAFIHPSATNGTLIELCSGIN